MAVYGAWASWLAGGHHVVTMHGSRYYARRLRRRIAMRSAIALSGQTVAVSNVLADQMSRDLLVRRSRIMTIANGVHPTPLDATDVRQELRLGSHDQLIVAVGNLYPVKGHQHLVDALALLAHRHPTLHLAICGRGELEDALRSRARERGFAHLHLLGLRSDVAAVLAAADLFVLPSLSEGLPLALLEAMFAGRPIVASDVGEVAATLDGGNAGVLVPAGNAAVLAAAIDDLLTHPARAAALGDRARARAAAHHDVSHMARCYRAIYDRLLTHATLPVARLSAGSARSNP